MSDFRTLKTGTGPLVQDGSEVLLVYCIKNTKTDDIIQSSDNLPVAFVLNDSSSWKYNLLGFSEGSSLGFKINKNGGIMKPIYSVSCVIVKVDNPVEGSN